ncbi:MAG: DNA polymerase Y family protein [Microbacterium sp.]
MSERVIVLWLPDWPVTAFLRTQAREGREPLSPDEPIAIVHAHRVVACSASARAEGVRTGQRRRDAQAACTRVRIVPADEGRDARAFHTVLLVLEELSPGVQPLRPGLAALRARGPSRFYGGEAEAAEALLSGLAGAGCADVRIGVADGVFAAEQAARAAQTTDPLACRIVPPDGAADFLAPLPVQALGDDEVALLLTRLGVRTLGDLALLDVRLVGERLGDRGLLLHSLARGSDAREVAPRVPPPELTRELPLEPPLELAEQVAFAARRTTDAFCDAIGQEGLVCTAVRIVIEDDAGGRSERVWQHPLSFDAAAVVDRIRWQLEEGTGREGPAGAVALVRIEPEAVDDGAAHQPALIGHGPNERAHHAMTRVQALLGHRGVLSPSIGGGREAREREVLRPWADGAAPAGRERPWPGSLPAPLPAVIFRERRAALVLGPRGDAVSVDERGLLSAPPATLDGRPVGSWAGPWPLVERDWDADRSRAAYRFQLVDDTGAAWLATRDGDRWWIEGRYA